MFLEQNDQDEIQMFDRGVGVATSVDPRPRAVTRYQVELALMENFTCAAC